MFCFELAQWYRELPLELVKTCVCPGTRCWSRSRSSPLSSSASRSASSSPSASSGPLSSGTMMIMMAMITVMVLHASVTLLSLGTSMILTSTHRSENSDLKRSQHTLIQMYQFWIRGFLYRGGDFSWLSPWSISSTSSVDSFSTSRFYQSGHLFWSNELLLM